MKITIKKACIETRKGFFKCRATPHNMANRTMHWTERKKWTDEWHAAVLAEIIDHKLKPLAPYKKSQVIINFYRVSFMDRDGSYNSAKPVIDGLRYSGIIFDDSEQYIDLSVKQIKVGHLCDEKTEIVVTKL